MPPSIDIKLIFNKLHNIINYFKDKPFLIYSDTNARHTIWGDHIHNSRGIDLYDFTIENNLIILNDNCDFTFELFNSSNGKSVIDLAISNSKMLKYISN